jgi:hypothetical protein
MSDRVVVLADGEAGEDRRDSFAPPLGELSHLEPGELPRRLQLARRGERLARITVTVDDEERHAGGERPSPWRVGDLGPCAFPRNPEDADRVTGVVELAGVELVTLR